MRRAVVATRAVAIATALALAACGRAGAPALPGGEVDMAGHSPHGACYVTPGSPLTVKATITFYGWPDNSPPGNAIAHPVIHRVASGDGTYCNPTTFATERSNDAAIPYGTKIYVPFLKQYFVREDLCAASGPPVGHGSNGCYKLWFDLWIGGTGSSNTNAVVNCEDALTPNAKVKVIVDPPAHLAVARPGPIYRNDPPPAGTCYGKPGDTSKPRFERSSTSRRI
jgi:predicted small lipoprotein YifL